MDTRYIHLQAQTLGWLLASGCDYVKNEKLVILGRIKQRHIFLGTQYFPKESIYRWRQLMISKEHPLASLIQRTGQLHNFFANEGENDDTIDEIQMLLLNQNTSHTQETGKDMI